jgi:predicted Zn-dependent protease
MERDNAFVWRQLGIAEGKLGRMPQADIALAEEAMLEGDYPAVRLLSRRAAAALPPGPLRLRAEDLRHAAQRDNLTREQRDAEDAMRRRSRR